MARVRDLWTKTVIGPDGEKKREPTSRHGNGRRWLAVWIGPDGKDQTKAFAKKSDAEKHATAMEADQLRGVYIDPKRGQAKLRQYAEETWLPALVHLRANSLETYRSHLNTHIYPAFGVRRPADRLARPYRHEELRRHSEGLPRALHGRHGLRCPACAHAGGGGRWRRPRQSLPAGSTPPGGGSRRGASADPVRAGARRCHHAEVPPGGLARVRPRLTGR
ncbi:hypothetical protein GCM10009733_005560 [Nonomuraea maheshkhaliensis]|uniref:Core-binding (CB) domain-containing protein n=1 Tax=Nonomuraea maheshkhaliensis TaxID=419590 RepID=A0ABN2EN02_9ACTN